MRNPPTNSVRLIEVGGRNGTTTDFVLAEQPHWKILILEPNPKFFWALLRKYDTEGRVSVLQKAAWNEDRSRQFFIGKNDNTSSLHKEKRDLVVSEEIPVACMRLSHFIRGQEKSRTLLNLNCEGAELEILEDLMDSGMYKHVKIMVGLHEETMPNPERYRAVISRMEELKVDFIGKHYRHLLDEAAELGIGLKCLLRRKGKEHWLDWFAQEED